MPEYKLPCNNECINKLFTQLLLALYLTVTDANNCSATDDVFVQVIPIRYRNHRT